MKTNLKCVKNCKNEQSPAFGILSFDDSELLSLNEKNSVTYAKFLLSVDYLNSLNIIFAKGKYTFEGKTYTDYYIYEPAFWTIATSIDEILDIDDKHEANIRYKNFLDLFNVPITDYRKE